VPDEVGSVAEQVGDVSCVDEEVLARGAGVVAVATTVVDDQLEAVVGEGSLGSPLLLAEGEGARARARRASPLPIAARAGSWRRRLRPGGCAASSDVSSCRALRRAASWREA
jgi:hypothetical protein